jgi:hypothetical protein
MLADDHRGSMNYVFDIITKSLKAITRTHLRRISILFKRPQLSSLIQEKNPFISSNLMGIFSSAIKYQNEVQSFQSASSSSSAASVTQLALPTHPNFFPIPSSAPSVSSSSSVFPPPLHLFRLLPPDQQPLSQQRIFSSHCSLHYRHAEGEVLKDAAAGALTKEAEVEEEEEGEEAKLAEARIVEDSKAIVTKIGNSQKTRVRLTSPLCLRQTGLDKPSPTTNGGGGELRGAIVEHIFSLLNSHTSLVPYPLITLQSQPISLPISSLHSISPDLSLSLTTPEVP